ncbi:hypothetical protein CAOG_01014 [Capsaspora owczarzaki ATCC 30864]|uniref:Uncharacterized protein n=1 Tax=Capsaspora owczarzaki (strain ATCC 30864) TaxID=595528 RepID=A0A0D2U320_CAPO3|nr:hypothetical protein CAOG_01014 [Capsaspora owczarzaki ATCC 30864]KJE89571.1 hypothetical protein CAOG_001014 [Capsaspora owczarzaki ATCC 30864]|eukprot:XP_004365885.2 hypothetical protein CAOG_01014 [Capsaspora owczarzaki ATCC 30864]
MAELAQLDGTRVVNARLGDATPWQLRFGFVDSPSTVSAICLENCRTREVTNLKIINSSPSRLELKGKGGDGHHLVVTLFAQPESRNTMAALRVSDRGGRCMRVGAFFDYCFQHIPQVPPPVKESRQYKSFEEYGKTQNLDTADIADMFDRLTLDPGDDEDDDADNSFERLKALVVDRKTKLCETCRSM